MSYLYVILAYLVILVLVGLYIGHRKVKNSEDFVVAGRSLPFIVLVGTLLASWCGGGGVTAVSYTHLGKSFRIKSRKAKRN